MSFLLIVFWDLPKGEGKVLIRRTPLDLSQNIQALYFLIFLFPADLGTGHYLRGGGGGYKTGGGGHVKFYPYEKGGGGKSFSHAEGGTQQVLG